MPGRARWLLLAPGSRWQAGAEAIGVPVAPLLNACWGALDGSAWRGGTAGGLATAGHHPPAAQGGAAPTSSPDCCDSAVNQVVLEKRPAWPWVSRRGANRPAFDPDTCTPVPDGPTASSHRGPATLASTFASTSSPSPSASTRERSSDFIDAAARSLSGSRASRRRLSTVSYWPTTAPTATTTSGVSIGSLSSHAIIAATRGALGGLRSPASAPLEAPPLRRTHGTLAGARPAAASATAAAAEDQDGDGEPNFVQVGRPVRTHSPSQPPATATTATTATTTTANRPSGSSAPPSASPPHSPSPSPTPSDQPFAAPTAASAALPPPRLAEQQRLPPHPHPHPVLPGAATEAELVAAGAMERIPIPPPAQRHQAPLPRQVSKELWRTSEELAAAGRLLRLQVGKNGVTRALMARAGHLLEHHQLIRLTLLQNCPLDVRFVAWLAENALDCCVIKVKGRTATLFREKGLPRPPASFPEDDPAQQQQQQLTSAPAAPSPEAVAAAAPPAAAAAATAAATPTGATGATGAEATQGRVVARPSEPRTATPAAPASAAAGYGGEAAAAEVREPVPARGPAEAEVEAAAEAGAGGGYPAALATRFRKWSAMRETPRLRLGVRRP